MKPKFGQYIPGLSPFQIFVRWPSQLSKMAASATADYVTFSFPALSYVSDLTYIFKLHLDRLNTGWVWFWGFWLVSF